MEFREQITIGFIFFFYAYFLSLGFWQVVGAYRDIRAFRLLPNGTEAEWSYLLGSVMMGAASVWFYGTRTEDIFCPGPASGEFLFFLSLGLFSALQTCLALSSAAARLAAGSEWMRRRETGRVERFRPQLWHRAL